MISSEIFDKLICANSNSDSDHYLIEPVALQCGHSICKICLLESDSHGRNIVKCKICSTSNTVNFQKIVEFQYIKQLIRTNFSALYESAIQNSEDSLQLLSGRILVK